MSLSVLTIPDGLQLAEVNGHGSVPSEVETVEGTVLLRLVNNSDNDVIIVTELIFIKLGIEHPYSAFRGSRNIITISPQWCYYSVLPVESQGYQGIRDPFIGICL